MPFVCSVCGEHHDERMLDIRMGLPDEIHALDEAEREQRAWIAEDFAVLDEEWFYVRGLLELPIPELESRFAYGAWAEVPRRDFKKLQKRWLDPRQFKPLTCWLANELTPYVGTTRLKATLRPVSENQLPLLELEEAPHELVRDQRQGISVQRADELAAVVLHR
jgi:hypothetical protein